MTDINIISDDQEDSSKRKYGRFKYSIEDLENALQAVRSGEFNLNKASFHFNIPKSTLSMKLQGKTIEGRRMGPFPVLSFEEEKLLEDWIVGKAKIGFAMHKEDVKDAVYNVMKQTGRKNPFINNRPGEKWVTLFLKRHPRITQRNTEIISKGKACLTEDSIRQWFQELQNYLEEENCPDLPLCGDRIYNADETGVECCPKTGKVMGPKNYRDFYTIAPGKEKESITVLANFSASGKKVPPMIVFPYKRIPRAIAESVPSSYFIGRSDSGWMVAPTFYEYIANCFYPWLIENDIQFPVLLLLDGHKSHINLELSKFCSEKRILLFSLLPNATNVLQPCDVGVFRSLKASWRASVRDWKQKNGNLRIISKINFTSIFKGAFDSSIDTIKIKNAFKKCGIFPFNVENIDFNKCMQNRHKELIGKRTCKNTDFSVKNDELFLQKLQSELSTDMLKSFTETFNDELNILNLQEPVLFSIWKKYKLKVEGCHITQTRPTEVETILINSDNDEGILNIDNDVSTNNQIELSTNEADSFDESLHIQKVLDQTDMESLLPITSKNDSLCPLTLGTPDCIAVKADNKSTAPENIWKDHLHWPQIKQNDESQTRRKKKNTPFAVTSVKWQRFVEAERAEKKIKEDNKKRKQKERTFKKEKKLKNMS